MPKVRTRYAPSPTGVPHIGNIRTALFNFLFAKNQKGGFILRIEDTDQKRSTHEHIKNIEDSLEKLGIHWDEKYQQSKRLKIYHKHLKTLHNKKVAYEDQGAWRFRVKVENQSQKIMWEDIVHQKVEFPTNIIEDFVIVKSDGYPTYHFASVVDDYEMQISHVIRGDEWISSTPKHLLLYEAFSWQPPKFCHVPVILGANKKKLSKREGAKSVDEYIKEGYLTEALVNQLALLGWAPRGDRELFTLDELIKDFSLERLNKNSPIFNLEKLNWFNKKFLQKLSTKELKKRVKQFSKRAQRTEEKKLAKILDLIRDRFSTLADFEKYSKIFFEKGDQKPSDKSKCETAKRAVESIQNWNVSSITKGLDEFVLKNKLESGDFKNTLRLAVFADNTPPIYESLAIIPKEETLTRIDDACKKAK